MFGKSNTPERRSYSGRKSTGASTRVKRTASAKSRPSVTPRAPSNRRTKPTRESSSSVFSRFSLDRFRLWSVGIVFTLLFCGLWARAYYLQIVKGPEYAEMAKRQHTAIEKVSGVRGHIMDRNGNVLARSVECSSVAVNPGRVENKQEAAVALAKALGKPVSKVLAQLQDRKQFLWLARKVDYHTAEAVRALKIPGITLQREYERVYPYKHLAGQLVGFVNIDDKGIEGLERTFNDELSGRSVVRKMERDAAGRKLMGADAGSLVDLKGRNIRLTIDTQVQFFAEEALSASVREYGARWGGCIVVDVPTGDVLAWAQFPFFDPNNISATPASDRRNRLASDMLEQGSTIKSFLIAAALEEKAVKPNTVINCERGSWKLGKVVLHDTHSYSNLSVEKILHVSSNIGVAKIGMMIGASTYYDYLTRLGFGSKTGLPLASEAKGILRPSERWSEVDLAAASFGQSFSTTLVQMAQAYMCLASDGIKRPLRLVMDQDEECALGENSTPPHAGERIFSARTMTQVRNMLREVVEEEGGTGKQARIPGMVVGGKTGTSQKADSSGKYGKGRVGSFVGMIPIEEPRYLVCVLLDEPTKNQYGGVVAAPVFRHVALNTMAYHGLLPDTDDPLVHKVARQEAERKKKANNGKAGARGANKDSQVFSTAASSPATASAATASAANARATSLPGNAARASREAPILTPSAREGGVVPAVVGMGLRSAIEIFVNEGVVPVVKGSGNFVVNQTPAPGRPWPSGQRKCTLWLEERAS